MFLQACEPCTRLDEATRLLKPNGGRAYISHQLEIPEWLLLRRLPGAQCRWVSVVLRMGNSVLGAHAWIALEEALGLNKPNRLGAGRQPDAEEGLLA